MKKINLLFLFFVGIFLCQIGYAQKNVQLRSVLSYPYNLSNIWGYVDDFGNEYALVGTRIGLSIVDVTDPDNPVEKFKVYGPSSIWRELKTWNKHVYVVSETSSLQGLQIIDLSNLPVKIDTFFYNDNGLVKSHTIFIDEKGFAYLFGSNLANGGAVILDLSNPKIPVQVGEYNHNYIHDGYARNDTLWAGEIYQGQFAVIDVSDKSNIQLLNTQKTPNQFTHNTWLSDDGKTLFTTDEVSGAFVGAYDVSDVNNIKEIDRYKNTRNSQAIPHNTHVLGNYLHTAYYTEGLTIVDATRPNNLVEVGNYDTSPFLGGGFNGAWGVYPYLPSGNVLIADIEEGLFVLTPTYTRACYLEGNVTNFIGGAPISNVSVEIMSTGKIKNTNILGNYTTGVADSGKYDVRYTIGGCYSKILTNVDFKPGIVNVMNVAMSCTSLVVKNNELNDLIYLSASSTLFSEGVTIYYANSNTLPAELTISDINGKTIKHFVLNEKEGMIELNDPLPKGMYFVKCITSNFIKTIKIIKI